MEYKSIFHHLIGKIFWRKFLGKLENFKKKGDSLLKKLQFLEINNFSTTKNDFLRLE